MPAPRLLVLLSCLLLHAVLGGCGQSGSLYLLDAPQVTQEPLPPVGVDITLDGQAITSEKLPESSLLSSAANLLPREGLLPNVPTAATLPALWLTGSSTLHKAGDDIPMLLRNNANKARSEHRELSKSQIRLTNAEIISALEYEETALKPVILRVVSGYLVTEPDNLNQYTVLYIPQGNYLIFSSHPNESLNALNHRINDYFKRNHTVNRLYRIDLIRNLGDHFMIYIPYETVANP